MPATNKKANSVVIYLACVIGLGSLPAGADCLSTPVTYNPGARTSKFEARVNHLKEQIATAESKGWINSEQASKFKVDYERIAGLLEQAKKSGMTTSDDVALEKEVTAVHHFLHYAIAGGHDPQKTLVAEDETKAQEKASTKSTSGRKRSPK